MKYALQEWEMGALVQQRLSPLAAGEEAVGMEAAVKLALDFGVSCSETSWVIVGDDV